MRKKNVQGEKNHRYSSARMTTDRESSTIDGERKTTEGERRTTVRESRTKYR